MFFLYRFCGRCFFRCIGCFLALGEDTQRERKHKNNRANDLFHEILPLFRLMIKKIQGNAIDL